VSIDELLPYFKENWATIKQQLLEGKYKPQHTFSDSSYGFRPGRSAKDTQILEDEDPIFILKYKSKGYFKKIYTFGQLTRCWK